MTYYPRPDAKRKDIAAMTPIPFLQLLQHTLDDGERTANAKVLLITGARAITRIVGAINILVLALAGLALASAQITVIGWVIGGGAIGTCLMRLRSGRRPPRE